MNGTSQSIKETQIMSSATVAPSLAMTLRKDLAAVAGRSGLSQKIRFPEKRRARPYQEDSDIEYSIALASDQFATQPCSAVTGSDCETAPTVGIVLPQLTNERLTSVWSGIEKELFQAGYRHVWVAGGELKNVFPPGPRSVANGPLGGVDVKRSILSLPDNMPALALSRLSRERWTTTIQVDHEFAADLALKHLVDLGHQRVAFVLDEISPANAAAHWAPLNYSAGSLRLQVSKKICRSSILDEPLSLSLNRIMRDISAGREDVTAFCCGDTAIAAGVVRAASEAGLSCPEDISVTSLDGIDEGNTLDLSLTTIRQPLQRMGALAARILLEKVHYPQTVSGRSFLVQPTLMVGTSTGSVNSARCVRADA
jgi:DNA-binding LacI/PurR family transcriptional regulator